MTKAEHLKLQVGDLLIVTQHGKDYGKHCKVLNPHPNNNQVEVRLTKPGDWFCATGTDERVMGYVSLGLIKDTGFTFRLDNDHKPKLTINNKIVAIILMDHNWITSTDITPEINEVRVEGYIDDETEPRHWTIDFITGTVTEQ